MVEKIAGERLPSVPERNAGGDAFDVGHGFLRSHGASPANRCQRKRTIKGVLEEKVRGGQSGWKDQKIQDVPPGFVFFE